MTKDWDKLKPPPGLVEELRRLTPPGLDRAKLALPPDLRQLLQQHGSREPLPPPVAQDVLDCLAAHAHDGDPQMVQQVRTWLEEQQLDSEAAGRYRTLVSAAPPVAATSPVPAAPKPKSRRSPKRDVIFDVLRELYPPDGRAPASVSDYKLTQQISRRWDKAWRDLKKSDPPEPPRLGAVIAAHRLIYVSAV